MPFLVSTDYDTQIRTEILEKVRNNPKAQSTAERMAQEEIESYLNDRYDVVNIFNKEGEQRSFLILMYFIDITLYHLHSNTSPRNIPELRGIRYEAAIDWLKSVATGRINPELPKLPNEDGSGYYFMGGSNDKYSDSW